MKMTVKTSDEDILKESLLDGMDLNELLVMEGSGKTPEGKAVKVYGKLAGLNCIGRLNFIYGNEISEKAEYANTQLMQKYGDEIYGKSGQAADGKSLIQCNVNPLMQLPDKFVKEASDNGGQELGKFIKQLAEKLAEASKNAEWAEKHKDVNSLIKLLNQINPAKGVDANKGLWEQLNKGLKTEPWASDIKGNKGPFNVSAFNKINFFSKNNGRNLLEIVNSEWTNFANANMKSKSGDSGSRGNDKLGKATTVAADAKTWNPRQTYKIEIKTNFNDEWYKRRFKSGFLNKVIDNVKTSIHAHADVTRDNDEYRNKKFSADQMEPGEQRKLNSIKWKMTNKVAKDFISLFCGWSRAKKEMYQEQGDNGIVYVPTKDCGLNPDKGFGDSMAKKALNGRGIFGRLKNALFAGGTDGSTITVAFQLDDPHNGWTIVEKKEQAVPDDKEKGKDEEEKPDSSDSSDEGGGESGGEAEVSESYDPFYEEFMGERMKLIKGVCEGKRDAYSLIEHCLLEE